MGGTAANEDIRGRLAGELSDLTRRLDGVRSELLAWRASDPQHFRQPPAGLGQYPPPIYPPPYQGVYPAPVAPGWWPPPQQPPPAAAPPAPTAPRATAPRPSAVPQPGRLLAWTGGVITLLGVVMLLVLAASRGWFGPLARVIAGGLLGLALVGIGLWLHRRPAGRTGALALAGTGVAALYLDVAAATALYDFLPVPVGLVLALAVAGGGLAIAHRWSAELLACGAVFGAAVLAPALTQAATPLLVALVLALQLAAAPIVWRRGWVWLAVVAAVWPVIYGSIALTISRPEGQAAATAAALAVLLVGAGLAVLAARRLPPPVTAGLLVAAPVATLAHAIVLERWPGAAVAAVTGVLMLAGYVVRRLPRQARLGAAAAGAVALFQATVIAFDGAALADVLLGQAVVLTVLAAVLRRRFPLLVAVAYGVVGLGIALVRHAPLAALVRYPQWPYVVDGQQQSSAVLTGLALSVLVLAAAVGFLVAAARVGWIGSDSRSAAVWGPVSAVALYGAAGIVITTALLIMPDKAGFLAGHAVVTVSWTVAALVLLARGISRPALRVAGMALVAAAVAKLVLFDLVELDGLARVGAFLGAGLVLLAAGARYARMVAQAREASQAAQAAHAAQESPADNPAAQPQQAG